MKEFVDSYWMGIFLAWMLLAGPAWGEEIEIVTYYPAPASTGGDFDRLHANRATVGADYNRTNVPDASVPDGRLLVFDRVGIGTPTPAGPLHVVGVDDVISSVVFMPGVDTAPVGDTDMRVGIGTTSPGAELDIYAPGDAVFARLWGASDGDNFSGLEFRSEQGARGPAGDRIWQFAHKQGGGVGDINDFHLTYFDGAGWFQRLAVTPVGNVGVGTTTPGSRLTVQGAGATASTSSVRVTNSAGAPLFFVRDDAFVGIGTDNPLRKFHIVQPGSGTPTTIAVHSTATDDGSGATLLSLRGNSTGSPSVNFKEAASIVGRIERHDNATYASSLAFLTTDEGASYGVSLSPTGKERMRIAANGNVGIGTQTPEAPLHVVGDAVKTTGPDWGTPSDIRLKENVRPIEGALEKLLRLKGVTFEWKDPAPYGNPPGPQMGMIGQQVEEVFPDWIKKDENGYRILYLRGMEALTLEAIRELKMENEALKERIRVLEEE